MKYSKIINISHCYKLITDIRISVWHSAQTCRIFPVGLPSTLMLFSVMFLLQKKKKMLQHGFPVKVIHLLNTDSSQEAGKKT